MPCCDVEWTVVLFVVKEFTEELVYNCELDISVFIIGDWSQEITQVSETIGTD